MAYGIGAAIGFILGVVISLIVYLLRKPKRGEATVSIQDVAYVTSNTKVDVTCQLNPNGTQVSGVWAAIYADENTVPPDDPQTNPLLPDPATFFPQTTTTPVTFTIQLNTPNPFNPPDLVAVWPAYCTTGGNESMVVSTSPHPVSRESSK